MGCGMEAAPKQSGGTAYSPDFAAMSTTAESPKS